MKTIYIGFSKPKSWFVPLSWAIRKIEGVPFSHVYIRFKSDSLDRDIIYHASKTMVHFMGKERFDKEAIIVEEYEFKIPDAIYKHMLQYAIDKAGISYGSIALIGLGFVKLARFFGFKIRNPFSDKDGSYICLELIGSLLWYSGAIDEIQELESIGLLEFNDIIKDIQIDF